MALQMSQRKKLTYDCNQMQLAVDACLAGMAPFKASREFGVPRTTLRNILHGKTKVNPK